MNRDVRRRRAPLAVLLLLVHSACYGYHTLGPQTSAGATASTSATAGEPLGNAEQLGLVGLEQGTSLRIFLSEPGSYPLNHVTPNTVMRIDGDLINMDEDVVRVSATWMKTAGVQEFKGNGETVTIQLDKIESVQEKRLSAGRTAATGVAIAGVVALLGVTFGTGSGEGSNGGGTPNPD